MLEGCSDLNVVQQRSPASLPFAGNSFDFITAVCVYHHVPEATRPAFTTEILRVLRAGGIFCMIEHNPLNPVTRLIVSRTPIDANARLLTARSARNLLSGAGCVVVDTRYFLFLPQRFHRHFPGLEDRLAKVPLGGQYCMMCTCRS
jgi:SAM-dependent methyltransferase